MANSGPFRDFRDERRAARKFYERAFGWRFEAVGPPDFYLLTTGSATDPGLTQGLLAKRSGPAAQGPLNAFRSTISVRSIKDSMAAVEDGGGKLRSPVVDIPEVGKVIEFTDPEDNVACMLEYLPGHPLAAR
jgi:predicted enzyme related to lactoylglutathione lyase